MDQTGKKEESNSEEKKWTQIAEVRMLMYVLPIGTALALVGLLLSQCTHP